MADKDADGIAAAGDSAHARDSAQGGDSAAGRPEDAAQQAEPTIAGLSWAEVEAAAMEGRQLAGQLEKTAALDLLQTGDVSVVGRLMVASNATFFCVVEGPGKDPGTTLAASCVYKPVRGERPLYDFPDGTLARREVAAHAVSEASGWAVVPPTVLRDGPFGDGMVQLWVEVDRSIDLEELIDSESPALRRMAILDAVLNNADRKGGHLLPLPDGRVQGCDNGLCFAVEPKLRTVLWRWRGQPLTPDEQTVLERLRSDLCTGLGDELRKLISPEEVEETVARVDRLLASGRLPRPDRNRPAIPWPPF
jgi:uncharacterized repeat protein (TIGR03843 family)